MVRYDDDSIQWAENWNIWTAGGTYTNPNMRIILSKETSNAKAEARLSATLNLANGGGSISRSLSLIVGKDSATARAIFMFTRFYLALRVTVCICMELKRSSPF